MLERALCARHALGQGLKAHLDGFQLLRAPVVTSFINGRYIEPTNDPSRDMHWIEPATKQAHVRVEAAAMADLDEALQGAQAAQQQWALTSGMERARALMDVAHYLRTHTTACESIECLDTGRPFREMALADLPSVIESFEYFAGVAQRVSGEHYDMGGGSFAYTRREPLGVCAGIGAWNYPMQGAAWKAAPAMATGNALVFKPSEHTPLSALLLAEAVQQVEAIPTGLFNVVLGDGALGATFATNPSFAKVSFTGSRATGLKITSAAAGDLKRVTMELGGKSPLIICADADLEQACRGAIMANFFSNGQVCSNGTRVFVAREVYQPFTQRLVELTAQLRAGDSFDEQVAVTPVIHNDHAARVREFLERARTQGATVLYGGEYADKEVPAHIDRTGLIKPHILTDCSDDMEIVREEVFGPVMAVLPFDTVDEAVRRANDTPYGLSAGVFTQDLKQAHRIIAELKAGTTWINDYNLAPTQLPWGGYKQSGVGRENGTDAINHWTQLKSVFVQQDEVYYPY